MTHKERVMTEMSGDIQDKIPFFNSVVDNIKYEIIGKKILYPGIC